MTYLSLRLRIFSPGTSFTVLLPSRSSFWSTQEEARSRGGVVPSPKRPFGLWETRPHRSIGAGVGFLSLAARAVCGAKTRLKRSRQVLVRRDGRPGRGCLYRKPEAPGVLLSWARGPNDPLPCSLLGRGSYDLFPSPLHC